MASNMTTHAAFDSPGTTVSNDACFEYLEINYNKNDIQTIRRLATEYMEYASLPIQKKTAELWRKMNNLEITRPMLWHNELPWHELNVDDELTLVTSSAFTRRIEEELRRRLYLWRHMPADMVMEPVFYSPLIIENSGMGISITEETSSVDSNNNIVSHKFIPQINCLEDIEKITPPVITLDESRSQATLAAYKDIFDSILPVEMRGVPGFWFAPVDDVVQLMGTEESLVNLLVEPELVHATMRKLMDVNLQALEQYEALGCLASNNTNYRVGSGAYGYTDHLAEGQLVNEKCKNMWGASASQFFTAVSPDMQREFSIHYEKEWLNRFGLSYYGCCERLDNKIEVLSEIKSLRKISMSLWSDLSRSAELIGRKYVASLKPSPAVFVTDVFDEDAVRNDISNRLETMKNCNVEIIIKDISTVNHDPKRFCGDGLRLLLNYVIRIADAYQ